LEKKKKISATHRSDQGRAPRDRSDEPCNWGEQPGEDLVSTKNIG